MKIGPPLHLNFYSIWDCVICILHLAIYIYLMTRKLYISQTQRLTIMVSLVEPCKSLEVWGERWNKGMNNGEIFGENREVLLNNWMGWGWKMATLSTLSPFKDNPHKIATSPEFRAIALVHLSHFSLFSALLLCYDLPAHCFEPNYQLPMCDQPFTQQVSCDILRMK